MAKRKGSNDAGRVRPGRYYDPGHQPAPPSHVSGKVRPPGPILGNRHHRRQRAAMSFVDQWVLARSVGFPVPGKPSEAVMQEQEWIRKWEALYTKGIRL